MHIVDKVLNDNDEDLVKSIEEDVSKGVTSENNEKVNLSNLSSSFFANRETESVNNETNNEDTEIEDEHSNNNNDLSSLEDRDGRYEMTEEISSEDLEDISTLGIELLDTGVSMLAAGIAKEKDASIYSIPEKKKKTLSIQLAKILEKYSIKLKLEVLFLFTIVLAFSSPLSKAMKDRKKNKVSKKIKPDIKKPKRKKALHDVGIINKGSTSEPEDVKEKKEEEEEEKNPIEEVEVEVVNEEEEGSFLKVSRKGIFEE